MNASRRWLTAIAGIGVVFVAIAYTGYVNSYLDHETQTTFFLKGGLKSEVQHLFRIRCCNARQNYFIPAPST
ncbi:hypothetical protein AWB81_05662 [Caballeronia arationis]|jgi:hypothetical protein|uniref:Uncharacterized protein n=1 Tax=Caballeronia arationis TaxID=1777142 RepID=A0A7Z7I4K9_9BURK|nr:hypothetical protein AWB81_05662 [Caballeronia arationis]SOE62138.1 hypothetical protein SAMN05446927_2255 [Caballeronia arationis]